MSSKSGRSSVLDRKNDVERGQSQQWRRRRFMRRWSIGVKLWTTTAILALPLIGLGAFYVQSLAGTLWFTQTEQQGQQLYHSLDLIIRDVALRQGARAVVQSGNAAVGHESPQDLDTRIDGELSALLKVDSEIGNSTTHGQVAALREKWSSLREAPQESGITYGAVLDAAYALKGQITSDWLLALDPELAAYDLLDISTNKLPDVARFTGELRAVLIRAQRTETYSPADAMRVVALSALVKDRIAAANDEADQALSASGDRPALAQKLRGPAADKLAVVTSWLGHLDAELSSGHPNVKALEELMATSSQLSSSVGAMQDGIGKAADLALQLRYDTQLHRAIIALSSSGICLLLAVLLTLALAGRISGAIKRLLRVTELIADGSYDNPIDVTGKDEISRLFAGIDTLQKKIKGQIESERNIAAANARIKQALDSVSTSVMVADARNNIIYVNPSMGATLREGESDLRRALPHFTGSATVLGSSLDVLHEQPEQQREILRRLERAHREQVHIGERTFVQTVNPIVGAAGDRIGTVLEWTDRTKELRIERDVEDLLADVLNGNLTRRIQVPEDGGFSGVMARSVNQLAETMLQTISAVKATVRGIHGGAAEIAQDNADLSRRTEEQSSSLEETASSMEQMTTTVKQNADNTSQANQLVSAARAQAEKGGQVTAKAVSAMTEINEASRKITDIIGVIDEIAFQTNLLALNAAVEAARAGEQGRGFAVVASEVRNLAGRSAAAAKEIKALIEDSTRKVEDGSVLVSESGKMLEQIVVAVKKVSDIVAEIASASREQSAGIEQVNRAVMQMDEMTQQNAAVVEQATAASQSMAEQASSLNRMLEKYQLGDADNAAPRHPSVDPVGLGAAA